MRTFSCFTFEKNKAVPSLIFIVSPTLSRARELARSELLSDSDGVFVEICEGAQLLCVETAGQGEKLGDLGS
jgi:hypothetical protein